MQLQWKSEISSLRQKKALLTCCCTSKLNGTNPFFHKTKKMSQKKLNLSEIVSGTTESNDM